MMEQLPVQLWLQPASHILLQQHQTPHQPAMQPQRPPSSQLNPQQQGMLPDLRPHPCLVGSKAHPRPHPHQAGLQARPHPHQAGLQAYPHPHQAGLRARPRPHPHQAGKVAHHRPHSHQGEPRGRPLHRPQVAKDHQLHLVSLVSSIAFPH